MNVLGGRQQSDRLQRRGRAVRGPRPRRSEIRNRSTSWSWSPFRRANTARFRWATWCRSRRHRPGADRPAEPHPAGDDQRQPRKPAVAAGSLASRSTKRPRQLNMGPEYKTGLLGRSKEMARMISRLHFRASSCPSFFVYLVIAAQFESWLHPITILLSLPLTFPFALISLMIFNQSLNLFRSSAFWCSSRWSRRTRFCRSTTPINSANRVCRGTRR